MAEIVSDEIVAKLKGQGIIQNKSKETFSVRIPFGYGVADYDTMIAVAEAAKRFGNGKAGLTSRMTYELMGVKYEDIEPLKQFLAEHGLASGGTGPKVRPIVACKGSICKFGLHDTFGLASRLNEEFYIGWHDVTLPAKFKIGIGGCPNNCIKPQLNDFGIQGGHTGDKCLKIFLGGKYGKSWRQGIPLEGFYTPDEAVAILKKSLEYYIENGKPKERFGDMIERIGFDEVSSQLLKF